MSSFLSTQFQRDDSHHALRGVQSTYATLGNPNQAERERLLVDQIPQVKYIAKRIHLRLPAHVLLEDLIHAGILGLIEAVQRFDPARHVDLKSYSKYRIHGAILDSLRDLDWSPRPLRRMARRIAEARQKLSARLGYPPSESQLAEELGMSLDKFQHLLGEVRGLDLKSLQSETMEEGSGHGVSALGLCTAAEDPFLLCLRSEMRELLAVAIGELPERECRLLALYYDDELTMRKVGAALGIGEARVSQLHSAVVIRLRTRMGELLRAPGAAPPPATSAVPPTIQLALRRTQGSSAPNLSPRPLGDGKNGSQLSVVSKQ
jgi:RNA polymerase sigma factor for flagellar operon FliA